MHLYGGGVMRTRFPLLSVLAVAAVVMLGGAPAASAQQVVKFGEGQTLTISGFVSATMFNDRGLFSSFGQGQNAEIAACPVPITGCTGQPGVNQGIFDGDVRNTRINFTFNAAGAREVGPTGHDRSRLLRRLQWRAPVRRRAVAIPHPARVR